MAETNPASVELRLAMSLPAFPMLTGLSIGKKDDRAPAREIPWLAGLDQASESHGAVCEYMHILDRGSCEDVQRRSTGLDSKLRAMDSAPSIATETP